MTPDIDKHAACLSVVVPAYNEETTLAHVVGKLLMLPHLLEVIVVDDCSTDSTPEVARRLAEEHPQVRAAHHSRNRGKTEALRTGFALTRGSVVIVQDADLEYDPAEIPLVIQPIIQKHADVVYGSRFLVRRATRVLYFYHYLANKFLTFLSNSLTNLNMTARSSTSTFLSTSPKTSRSLRSCARLCATAVASSSLFRRFAGSTAASTG